MNKVLVDLNICLDVVLNRKLFVRRSTEIIERCEKNQFAGLIVAHSFDTMFYVLNQEIGREKAYKGVQYVREVFEIADVSGAVIDDALALNWSDFEDAIHYQAALHADCEAIVYYSLTTGKKSRSGIFPFSLCILESRSAISS